MKPNEFAYQLCAAHSSLNVSWKLSTDGGTWYFLNILEPEAGHVALAVVAKSGRKSFTQKLIGASP
jgi:hypothetical protein